MPRYKVTYMALRPVTRSVFVDDNLDELNEEDILMDAWDSLRDYLEANGEETADWDDPTVEVWPPVN